MASLSQKFFVSLLGILILGCGAGVHAQQNAPQPESLLIGPGDTLHIQVFGEPELEDRIRVSDAGNIRPRLIGTIHVGGLSSGAAAAVIERALVEKSFLLHPSVTVSLDDYSGRRVTVFGEVRTPGAFVLPTSASVLDVLALAGGLTDVADRRITIERQGSGERATYFVSNSATDLMNSEVRINPGDRLFIPKAGVIYILGDVHAPGGYAMTNNEGSLTAMQLVARAGGTNTTAAPDHAIIVRGGTGSPAVEKIKIGKIRKGKVADEAMQAGDILYIPFSYLRNFAVNAVGITSTLGSAAIYKF